IKYTYESISNNINEIKIEIINDYSFNKSIVDNLLNNCFLEINKLPNEILKFKRNNKIDYFSFDFQSHKIKDDSTYYPFVKTGLAYNIDIVDHFSDTILSDINLKKEFLNHIKLFSNEIYDFSISTTEIPKMNTLMVLFENGGSLPLFMMGDGTIRLVRLILEILKSKNSRLMIDEIDNGIHFSRMKEVWRVILKVAKQNNTQLFLTTHDAECLKMFKEVLEEEDMVDLQNDVACFTLFRNKEKMVDSVQYNFKEFEHAIDYSLNIRG
ncbi:MAG: AAA family ATPase, partial [Fluviicola sp.]